MSQKAKKILRIVGDCVFGVFMALVVLFAISNIKAKNNKGLPSVFGSGYLTIESNSMAGDKEDNFNTGDLITVKVFKHGSKDLQIGQIITYYDHQNEKIVTHRIVSVYEGIDGHVTYTVKGDATPNIEVSYYDVRDDYVLALYKGKVTGIGPVVKWFQSPFGFFVIVVLPSLLFLVVELVQFIKTYAEVKGEKTAKKSEEELAKEREEMKRQLLEELKAEMRNSESSKENEEVKPE